MLNCILWNTDFFQYCLHWKCPYHGHSLISLDICVKTHVMLQRTLVWILLSKWGGTQDGVHDVRHKLNLLAGSLVTVAYRLLETMSESRQSSGWRWTETVCPAQRVRSENGTQTKGFCDVLVDFQTGEIPSTGWMYIYTFVN